MFGAKNFFLNIRLSQKTSYGFLTPFKNLENTNDPIPKKNVETDGQMEGWTCKSTQLIPVKKIPLR